MKQRIPWARVTGKGGGLHVIRNPGYSLCSPFTAKETEWKLVALPELLMERETEVHKDEELLPIQPGGQAGIRPWPPGHQAYERF